MGRMTLRIFPDGRVQGDIKGVKGKTCTNYIHIIEEMIQGQTWRSDYTEEFFETTKEQNYIQETTQDSIQDQDIVDTAVERTRNV